MWDEYGTPSSITLGDILRGYKPIKDIAKGFAELSKAIEHYVNWHRHNVLLLQHEYQYAFDLSINYINQYNWSKV